MSTSQAWLDSLQGSGIRPGLDRMRRLALAAGNPHRAYSSTLIAGTNGKGSTAATLHSILEASGVRTGLYTSPHLVRINERWRIGGADITNGELDEMTSELRAVSRRAGVSPTYFEALTLMAFLAFRSARCEHAVFEVGMGGRLDATNILRPLVSIVTNVALDHQEFLGSTLTRIAKEKAGIIHRGSVAVTASREPDALRILRRRCAAFDVPLHVMDDEVSVRDADVAPSAVSFTLITPHATHRLKTRLQGAHQIDNVSLAVRAAELLAVHFPVSETSIRRGVEQASWRGRAERFEIEGTTVIVDGAHNPAGSDVLARYLEQHTSSPRVLVFAAMRDKKWRLMLERLGRITGRVVMTIADSERGEDPDVLARAAADAGIDVSIRRDPIDALSLALSQDGARTVVVAGSLYLAGAVLPWLDGRS